MKGGKIFKTTPEVVAPLESGADGNIENVRQNRHLSLRMIADEPDISEDTVREIVVEDLEKKRRIVCERFVPHALTAEQEKPVDACQDLIELAGSDPDFFKESRNWRRSFYLADDPATKRQSFA